MPTVFHIEDEQYVIDDLKAFFEIYLPKQYWHVEGFLIEGSEANENEVVKKARECKADVVVLDLQFGMSNWAGLNLIEPLRIDNPQRPIIVCTVKNHPEIWKALEKCAWDCISKGSDSDPNFNNIPSYIPKLAKKINFAEKFKSDMSNDSRLFKCPQTGYIYLPEEIVGSKWKLYKFLIDHPFEKNIFIMTKYRNSNISHREIMNRVIREAGFYPVIAKNDIIIDDLYNSIACLICSKYGIALFDKPEDQQIINPNVCYELGMMHLQGKKCLILKSNSLEKLQTDILQKLYKEYNESNLDDLESKVKEWICKLPS